MRRKILSMLTLLTICSGFASCDEDFDNWRSETRDEVDWTNARVTIDVNDWIYDSNGNGSGYYYSNIKVKEIDKEVYRYGLVCCYLYDGDVQTQLPCTRYMTDGKHEWQRTIDFDFYRRGVTIYVTDFVPQNGASDNFVPDEPEDMKFRIAVIK